MKVAWRRVASWHCSACGVCCRHYRVRLSAYEYLKLKWTGFVEEKNGRFYIRKVNGRCPFQIDSLCSLQKTVKPLACKLYPFSVYTKGNDEAAFEYDGEEYYVYVDTFCPNVRVSKGRSERITEMVREAVMLFRMEGEHRLLTKNLGAAGNLKYSSFYNNVSQHRSAN